MTSSLFCLKSKQIKKIGINRKYYEGHIAYLWFNNNTYKQVNFKDNIVNDYLVELEVEAPDIDSYILIRINFTDDKADFIVFKCGKPTQKIFYTSTKDYANKYLYSILRDGAVAKTGILTPFLNGFYFSTENLNDGDIVVVNNNYAINSSCDICIEERNKLTSCENNNNLLKEEIRQCKSKKPIQQQTVNIVPNISNTDSPVLVNKTSHKELKINTLDTKIISSSTSKLTITKNNSNTNITSFKKINIK